MMTVARQPLDAKAAPSSQSLRALDEVNSFVGGALAGFGPFVALCSSVGKPGRQRTLALF
jgi:hypothetical protein